MENHKYLNSLSQAEELFRFYDRAGIGVITKKALLSYFGMIDKLITEQWLSKILLAQGIQLKQYIQCDEFTKIMQALSSVPEDDDVVQCRQK